MLQRGALGVSKKRHGEAELHRPARFGFPELWGWSHPR